MSNNTNNTHLNDTGATCYKCDEPVPLLYLHGKNDPLDETWVCCAYTGWYCPSHLQTSHCGDTECVGCNPAWFFNKGEDSKEDKEDKEDEESESESEDEPEGECCAGVTDPRIVITIYTCVVCDKAIVRDSAEHDQSILVNCGDDIICPDCPRKCKAECGECVVCDSDWSDDDVTDADREEARWEALWEEE